MDVHGVGHDLHRAMMFRAKVWGHERQAGRLEESERHDRGARSHAHHHQHHSLKRTLEDDVRQEADLRTRLKLRAKLETEETESVKGQAARIVTEVKFKIEAKLDAKQRSSELSEDQAAAVGDARNVFGGAMAWLLDALAQREDFDGDGLISGSRFAFEDLTASLRASFHLHAASTDSGNGDSATSHAVVSGSDPLTEAVPAEPPPVSGEVTVASEGEGETDALGPTLSPALAPAQSFVSSIMRFLEDLRATFEAGMAELEGLVMDVNLRAKVEIQEGGDHAHRLLVAQYEVHMHIEQLAPATDESLAVVA